MRGLAVTGRLLAGLLAAAFLCAAQVALTGRVVDENDAPVRDALVTVRPASAPATAWTARTSPAGEFSFSLPAPGDYLIGVQREGYYELKDRATHIAAAQVLDLVINTVREVFQSVDVGAATSPLEAVQTGTHEQLTGTEVNDVPYANSHSLRNALPMMPGVVQDATGGLHINGSSENQVLYQLNSFNITDPITGQFHTLLAVEGIRSIDLASGRYSSEFGKGSAGAMNISTESGTDRLHYTATDFIPGLSLQQGLHLGNWYPRLGVSGPIVKGRAWFSDTFDSEYTESLVTGLPSGQNTRSGWAGSNLLHTQVNLTPSDLLYADFLFNIDNQDRVGLGPLNPAPVTSTVHTRQYSGTVKDQKYFGRGALVEFGYAHHFFSDAQSPQGSALFVIAPQGNSGNYFLNETQNASRDQLVFHAYLPKFHLAGEHQVEAGADADWIGYDGNFRRTGYQVLGSSGQILSQTLFPAPARFHVSDTEAAAWVLDRWRPLKQLQVTLALRQDWDGEISDSAWSPRMAATWSPTAAGTTAVSGGYAITHDAVTMGMLGLPLDQTAYTTVYANGEPSGPAAASSFTIGGAALHLPRAANWTVEATHRFAPRLTASAKYLRRRGTEGFAFLNTMAPDAPPSLLPLPSQGAGLYQLTNLRRDDYDAATVEVRQTLTGQFEWMASYTRSRAQSNAVIDPNFPQPLQLLANLAPMPWNVPNRLLAWAYLPLPWKDWAVTALADLRTGFAFSVRDPSGVVQGAFDSYRYPMNFDLNIAIERMVTLRGYRFALRGGVDNLTARSNFTSVNNVTGVPGFLQFLGPEGRHFVVRIRFFGRGGGK